jgi:NAD-dependent deacetylase
MIVMDRDNLFARGWSHVVSTGHDVSELEAFRVRVGAPPPALQLGNPRWPHLDLRDRPREIALAQPDVRIFDSTLDLVKFMRTEAAGPSFAEARRLLALARRPVVLTGAGISADSGVPTFRGAEGLWRDVRPEEIATPEAFAKDPVRSWAWYAWRREKLAGCRPNAGHLALARWLIDRPGGLLVTQNVDGLHELAALEAAGGDSAIAARAMPTRLHGSIVHVRCPACGFRAEHRGPVDASAVSTLPHCDRCGNLLRPDVVWFGEALPPDALQRALEAAGAADVCLVVGTQGAVYPAAGVADTAQRSGAALVVVDPGSTHFDARADVRVREGAAQALPKLLDSTAQP